jgi:hypothetical protein
MPRTLQLAALAKLDAVPFSTDFRSLRETRPGWDNWVFSSRGLELSIIALRDIIAMTLDTRARGAPGMGGAWRPKRAPRRAGCGTDHVHDGSWGVRFAAPHAAWRTGNGGR